MSNDKQNEPGVWVTQRQVKLCGDFNTALFLSQCLYWSNRDMVKQRQGWFYKSRAEWQDEICLSRFQQENARKKLREMGLLVEDPVRTNIGIRIWYRVNLSVYYALLNKLSEQSEADRVAETADNSGVLYDSSLSERSENNKSDGLDINETSTESKYINNNKTIVLNTGLNEPLKPENGTLVSDNNTVNNNITSDNHCIDNDDIEIIECVEQSVEADASPLSENLTNCPDRKKHRIDPDAFLFNHPFIYQFVRYSHNSASDAFLETLVRYGFSHFDVQEELVRYVERHGHAIIEYYRKNSPMELSPLTRADIDDAVRASLEV